MLRKLFLGIFTAILFFVMLDMALRVYLCFKYKNKKYLPFANSMVRAEEIRQYGKRIDFNGYYKFTPGKYGFKDNPPFTINKLGFRNIDFSIEKRKNIIRTCVFGGSTTFCVKVRDEETYPYYMQQIMNSYQPSKYEVINCGFSGYLMTNIYNLLKKEVVNFNPDIIIINCMINDIFTQEYSFKETIAFKVHKFLYNRWILYMLSLEKYCILKYKDPLPRFYQVKYKLSEDYFNKLKSIISLAKEKNIAVILMKEPLSLLNTKVAEDYFSKQLESRRWLIQKQVDTYKYVAEELTKIGKQNNLLVIDPNEILAKRPELFLSSFDMCHLSPEGNKLLAEFIVNEVFNHKKEDMKYD